MKTSLLAVFMLGFISCVDNGPVALDEIVLQDVNGQFVNLKEAAGNGITVFIFMSTDCPLCINYTKTIKELQDKFKAKRVKFLPVYSGEFHEKSEIIKFNREYEFELQSLMDPELLLTKKLKATITPQAIIISADGRKVYTGAIDNWMFETGKKSPIITKKYLETALIQMVNGKDPEPGNTKPVGCFIEL